ncbi:MAG TPA: HAMP domain-containing sensor histidine kinase [Gaiellaceae bacterium]
MVAAGAAVAAAALALLPGTGRAAFAGAAVLLVASILAEAFPVPIEGVAAGATSLATIFMVATATLYSWQLATLVGLLTMLLIESWRRKPIVRSLYNTALYALSGAAAGAMASVVGSRYAAVLAGAAAFYVVDVGLLAAVIARARETRYSAVIRSFAASTVTPFVVMAATTAILVELWSRSVLLALLLAPPLFAIAVYQRSLHTALERQRELDRLKEEFVVIVSHELRTPLASVYGGVETLQRKSLDEGTRDRVLAVVREQAVRLAKLVDDVLWASRLDGPGRKARLAPFAPARLVREVVASAEAAAPGHVELSMVLDGDAPSAVGDEEHVRRVLANLIENAIKYSPDGGTITVALEAEEEFVRFVVRDEGIGVADNDRDRIFDKFTRLDPEMMRGVSGTGLGLYICRELVEGMGGRIWAEPNPGKGTTFVFELPVASATMEGATA